MNLILSIRADESGKHPFIEASTDQPDGFELLEVEGLELDRARSTISVARVTVRFHGKWVVEESSEEAAAEAAEV